MSFRTRRLLAGEDCFSLLTIATKTIDQLIINSPNGKMLVLEVKGQSSQQDATRRDFLNEWVRAVNQYGGFGIWAADVSFSPTDLTGILAKHS